MILTFLLSVILMTALFLMLFSAVALIQDKRLFTSAPKDIQEAIIEKDERFLGAHKIGWTLLIISVAIFLLAFIYGVIDGVQNNFSFLDFFWRFLIILLLLKVFDILFFDYYLLCHSNFYPHYYPEIKEFVGPHQFGFNKKMHIITTFLCPLIAIGIAFICTLF